jgi:hypothetical protein
MDLARCLLCWPVALAASLGLIIISSLVAAFTALRPLILILWFLALISVLSTESFTAPTSWYGRTFLRIFMPAKPKALGWSYNDQSQFDHNQQAIYVWYPHGHLGIGAFGTVVLGLGDDIWKRPTSLCVAPPFLDIPALRQISLSLGLVRSDELNMKAALNQGTSLMVLPGGVAERNLSAPAKMKLVDGRRGFLRIARQHRLPIIPIFGFGENDFFDEPARSELARGLMSAWHGSLDAPSWSAIKAFIAKTKAPLKVCLGPALMPEDFGPTLKAQMATWKTHVSLAYELCRPTNTPNIEWIKSPSKNTTKH